MKKPHVHAECIIAWANGADIEWRYDSQFPWKDCHKPIWDCDTEYRIKPEPKPDIVRQIGLNLNPFSGHVRYDRIKNIRVIFDGETLALKSVEMMK